MNLTGRLEACNLEQAFAAIAELSSGALIEEWPHVIPCKALIRVYERRREHLRQFQTHHSRALERSVEEFIRNLHRFETEQGHWVLVRGNSEFHYNIFVATTGRLLCCLRLASKLELSGARWNELWHGDAV